jgi:hypothetical protein
LQKKSSGPLWDIEAQLQIGALAIDLRHLHVEQKVGILHAEPALRFVLDQTTEISCVASGSAP